MDFRQVRQEIRAVKSENSLERLIKKLRKEYSAKEMWEIQIMIDTQHEKIMIREYFYTL